MRQFIPLAIIFSLLISCGEKENPALASFGVFCEMIANDAKPLALSSPMTPADMDKVFPDFQKVADDYGVSVYREDEFPVTMLFPESVTKGKSVAVLYKGSRLVQYEQLKADVKNSTSSNPEEKEALARRFGRLLGYGSEGINLLLSKNTNYRNLASFGVEKQVTHFYYDNLEEAINFYEVIIGFKKTGETMFQISSDAYLELHPFDEVHPKGQAKSTAIAFLTDQLKAWYEYVQERKVPIKYTYKPREGGPHDGFVAIDPGGYLLEFEQFKQHPENELFMAELAQAPSIDTAANFFFYGSITWTYHNDLLAMQKFYEEVLGFTMVADQGWTKIYKTSKSGFIGLVDERRGMEDYADTKAVEIEWQLSRLNSFDEYASEFWESYSYNNNAFRGPEKYMYQVSSTD